MALEQKFFDDFDNATVDVQTSPGNGTISEPAGTELRLAATAGTQTTMGSGSQETAPIAYEEFMDHLEVWGGLVRVETRVSGHVRTGVEVIGGLCLWKNRDYLYNCGWYDSNNYMYLQGVYADESFTAWNSTTGYGDPETTPHRYRFYLNLTKDKVITPEGFEIGADRIALVFSVNDGSSWVLGYSENMRLTPDRFGVFVRNWSTGGYRGYTVDFDYLELSQDLEPKLLLSDVDDQGSEDAKGLFQDDVRFPAQAGTPRHAFPSEGEGVLLGDTQIGDHTAGPKALFSDKVTVIDAGGDVPHGGPLASTGERRDLRTYFEDRLGVVNPDADYVAWKQDGDGNDLLQDIDVHGVLLFDATAGTFGTPTAGHTAIAQNGKYYYDGEECGPGDFGTIADGPRRTAWPTWTGGAEPWNRTTPTGMSLTMTADDVLRLQGTNIDGWDSVRVTTQYGWRFRGDFDIELEYFDWSSSGGSDGGLQLNCYADSYNQFYVRRRGAGGNIYDKDVKINNSWGNYASAATTDTAGKIRVVRSGTVVSQYYWDGVSAWVQIGSSVDMAAVGAVPVWILITLSGTGLMTTDVKITNFTINSGTTDNTARWTWEASGTHRGTQTTMPDKMAVVTTQSSLDLIDVTNNKLWMRFIQGTNNMMKATATGVRVRQAKWDNGLLFVAYGDEAGSGGAAFWIDFTVDGIRWHRTDGDGATGGLYGYPVYWSRGCISERNNARNYANDYSEWQIPSNKVDCVDIFRDGTYEYRAVATYAGMGMYKLRRWHNFTPEYSLSTETGHMRWCRIDSPTGELFYIEGNTLHSRDRTGAFVGWEDVMSGSTFTAQYSKALPGRRHLDSQYQAVRYSPYVFIPAWEGVYRVNWPSGSWELFYGKPGSGATHEILPDYQQVLSITFGQDGATDLLAIGLRFRGLAGGQIIVVKLSDNSVYGVSRATVLEDPRFMGAA